MKKVVLVTGLSLCVAFASAADTQWDGQQTISLKYL